MKLNIYLDESGNQSSKIFTIGGFYYFQFEDNEIETLPQEYQKLIMTEYSYLKLKNNFKRCQKSIIKKTNFEGKELKWINLSQESKIYLFSNLPKLNQNHLCIMTNLDSWQNIDKKANFNIFYNYLIKIMILNLIRDYKKLINNLKKKRIKLNIEIFIDDKTKKITAKKSLEEYLKAETLFKKGVNFKAVHYQNSFDCWYIQYADYIAGLYNSFAKTIFGCESESYQYNREIYLEFHQNYSCLECYKHSFQEATCSKKIKSYLEMIFVNPSLITKDLTLDRNLNL